MATGSREHAGTGPQQNVGSTERALSVLGGGALALSGLKRGGASGLVLGLVGASLVQRGVTGHCQVYGALGISTAEDAGSARALPERHSVHVEQTYTIDRPADELYRFWHRFENLPTFMEHLESVEVTGDGRSHWVAKGPAGTHVEWDAEVTEDVPGERIAWRSLEGSEVANAGSVRFRPAPAGRGTEVEVSLEYAPPAGVLGKTVAKLFGENPQKQVEDDLRHFKQLMEAGETPTTEGQSSGRR